jgi:hypothetical protein
MFPCWWLFPERPEREAMTMSMPTEPEPARTDPRSPTPSSPTPSSVERVEVVAAVPAESEPTETVSEPAKVMRIGSMVKQLLEEVRNTQLDEPSRERLAEIYERSIVELTAAFSPDLQDELRNLALPFRDGEIPTEAELRIAKAQLVGWLEGLFHGIQATLFAQQLAARQQLEQMRQLPPGMMNDPGMSGQSIPERPGTYL